MKKLKIKVFIKNNEKICKVCNHPLSEHWEEIGCGVIDKKTGVEIDACKHCEEDVTWMETT